MAEHVEKSTISLAAEYTVASELCRRGVYAQLTLGNLKRTDLLAFWGKGNVVRIEVKAKQGRGWPSCKGISGKGTFLVFVDYRDKRLPDRPDFYVLSTRNWRNLVKRRFKAIQEKDPEKRLEIGPDNLPIFPDQITKSGKPWTGMMVTPSLISRHKEAWNKIMDAVGVSS